MGLNRSKYLAEYLRKKGYNTKYGGVGPCKWDPVPANPICNEDVKWADIIITARDKHKPILVKDYKAKNKRIICLEVTDSQKEISKIHPKFKDMERSKFNKKWTQPQLRKALKPYLPLEK